MTAGPLISAIRAWRFPPESPTLGDHTVHVWRARLDQTAQQLKRFLRTLAADEQRRAGGFFLQRHREHFIVARGVLRAILGRYLHTEPGQLHFCYSSHGKPALCEERGGDTLRFNISHSDGLALVAVTCGRRIGVDLERIRPDLEVDHIAERFFSAREVATLRALPANRRREAFFTCWTRKEAYIKARGEGLSLALDQFDVSVVPGEPAALLSTREGPNEASRWFLQELPSARGYVAALAAEGHVGKLECWQWPGEGTAPQMPYRFRGEGASGLHLYEHDRRVSMPAGQPLRRRRVPCEGTRTLREFPKEGA